MKNQTKFNRTYSFKKGGVKISVKLDIQLIIYLFFSMSLIFYQFGILNYTPFNFQNFQVPILAFLGGVWLLFLSSYKTGNVLGYPLTRKTLSKGLIYLLIFTFVVLYQLYYIRIMTVAATPFVYEPDTYNESIVLVDVFYDGEKIVTRVNATNKGGAALDKVVMNLTDDSGIQRYTDEPMVDTELTCPNVATCDIYELNYTPLVTDAEGTWLINITANDTNDDRSSNSTQFTVKIPPKYYFNSTNDTTVEATVEFSLFWNDTKGLSYYIFSLDNCTGAFQNITNGSLVVGNQYNQSNTTNITGNASTTDWATINTSLNLNSDGNLWNVTEAGESDDSTIYNENATVLVNGTNTTATSNLTLDDDNYYEVESNVTVSGSQNTTIFSDGGEQPPWTVDLGCAAIGDAEWDCIDTDGNNLQSTGSPTITAAEGDYAIEIDECDNLETNISKNINGDGYNEVYINVSIAEDNLQSGECCRIYIDGVEAITHCGDNTDNQFTGYSRKVSTYSAVDSSIDFNFTSDGPGNGDECFFDAVYILGESIAYPSSVNITHNSSIITEDVSTVAELNISLKFASNVTETYFFDIWNWTDGEWYQMQTGVVDTEVSWNWINDSAASNFIESTDKVIQVRLRADGSEAFRSQEDLLEFNVSYLGTPYNVEVEHNTTVSYSGEVKNISIQINFTSTQNDDYTFYIYNFTGNSWYNCNSQSATANTYYNLWCNVSSSDYNSSSGIVRVRLNSTEDSDQATLSEEYVQYFVEYYPNEVWTNVTRVINDTADCTMRWKVYANDSDDNWNRTVNFSFDTTSAAAAAYLEVNLTNPAAGSMTILVQNTTFNVNATVTCRGGDCGNVNGTVRYNGSSANPDTPVNSTPGDVPFHNTSGDVMQTCGTLDEDELCQLNWTINATGDLLSGWMIGVLFNSSDGSIADNHTDNATIKIIECTESFTIAWNTVNFNTIDPNTDDNAAGGNDNQTYNISNTGTCDLNIYIKGTNLTNTTSREPYDVIHTIGVGNITWHNTTNSPSGAYTLTTDYVILNSSFDPDIKNITTYYWLSVPPIPAGKYNGTMTYCANTSQQSGATGSC